MEKLDQNQWYKKNNKEKKKKRPLNIREFGKSTETKNTG